MRNVIFAILMLAGVVVLAQAAGLAATREPSGAPIRDRALERRLTVETHYTARRGDTLQRIAYYLYGHRSWWIKLRRLNPAFARLGPDSAISPGTSIRYRAPKIGDTYVVQPNDWLIRIVEWKYGARDYWQKVFQSNADRISNPNLIRPGDRLTLLLDGTVAQSRTGEILMRGISPPKTGSIRELAASPSMSDRYSVFGIPGSFVVGFGVGVVGFLLFPVFLWFRKRDAELDHPERFRSYLADNSSPKKKAKSSEPRAVKRKSAPGFKRRPTVEPIFDRSWIPRLEPEDDLDRRPGYFSLISKKKKPLKTG